MSPVDLLHADPAPRAKAARSAPAIVACVQARGHVAADLATIDALRRDPGRLAGRELPASFLKHADEQSVCGFAAVLQAIRDFGLDASSFATWGVVGAPRFPGRLQGGAAIMRFFDQGVRGISPQIIPQTSLHSLSGVISVGLGMGGPNLGAGGGARAISEGLLTALTLLAEGRLPGLWLVLSEWDREPTLQKNGRPIAEGQCHALAMALTRENESPASVRLELHPPCSVARGDSDAARRESSATSVAALAEALRRIHKGAPDAACWTFPLDWGASVSLAAGNHSS